jgi:tRNA modification GTPase
LVVVKQLFEACLLAGARTARPGEFSERAFANGKMDLAQAEAVAQLVQARTSEAARAARRQMTGELSRTVNECRDILLGILARVEASIDFTEELGELNTATLASEMEQVHGQIANLLRGAAYGKRLVEGMTLVLTGRPNVGKSSLLNAFAGVDRAIVTPIPGTTRDVLSEAISLGGIPVRALDTAGLRDTQDVIEQIGVERARQAVETADVVVVVLDATRFELSPDEITLLAQLQHRPHVVAVNKADVGDPARLLSQVAALPYPPPCVPIVAQRGQIAPLVQAVVQSITGDGDQAHDPLVTSARHENALRLAQTSVQQALQTASQSLPAELIAVDVHAALSHFGEITGETTRDDVIQSIFARFCLGK